MSWLVVIRIRMRIRMRRIRWTLKKQRHHLTGAVCSTNGILTGLTIRKNFSDWQNGYAFCHGGMQPVVAVASTADSPLRTPSNVSHPSWRSISHVIRPIRRPFKQICNYDWQQHASIFSANDHTMFYRFSLILKTTWWAAIIQIIETLQNSPQRILVTLSASILGYFRETRNKHRTI